MNSATVAVCRSFPLARCGPRMPSRAGVGFFFGERHGAETAARRVFGRPLLPGEYAGLAGAPDDAVVEVGTLGDALYIELRGPPEQAYRAFLLVFRRRESPVILCDGFQVLRPRARGQGIGLDVLARQLACAVRLCVGRIELVAGRRRDREHGYYAWPRYGFDGPLPARLEPKLPTRLRHARSVLDLMQCPRGRQWWKDHGVSLPVAFDLSRHSRSWEVFHRYARHRMGARELGKAESRKQKADGL